jgi:hypothetical protein
MHPSSFQRLFRLLSATLVAICLAGLPASAQDSFTWYGSNSQIWTDTCNWQPPGECDDGVPYPGEESAEDQATILHTGGGPGVVLLPKDITIGGLTLGDGGYLISPGTGSMPTLTVRGTFDWSNGGELRDVRLVLAITALSTASGSDTGPPVQLLGGVIVNDGLFTWTGGNIRLHNSARFENRNLFVAATSATFRSASCCLDESVFRNTGRLEVPLLGPGGLAPAPVFDNLYFRQEGGTIGVAAGSTLTVAWGRHFFSASSILEGGGRTVFTRGEFDLDGLLTIGTGHTLVLETDPQNVQPSINGIATVQGTGTLSWQGGTIQGDITVADGIAFRLEGDQRKNLNQKSEDPREVGRLTLNGNTEWSGAGDIRFFGHALLLNRGTFTARSDAAMSGASCCLQPSIFSNEEGAFVKDGGTGVTSLHALTFLHRATVDVRTGVFDIGLGPHTISDGARYEGAGRTRISGGQATLGGDVEVAEGATLELASGVSSAGGQLYGEGRIGGEGTFAWTGGTIGGNVELGTGLTLEISGPGTKTLLRSGQHPGRLLSHAQGTWREGPIVLSGSAGGSAALFVNAGTLAIESHETVSSPSCCLTPSTFVNQGRLIRRNDADTTRFVSVRFENRGDVELEDGVILFGRPAPVQLEGTFLLRGGHVAARDSLPLLGGRFGGVGTVATRLINRGATVAPGDPVGTLTVAEYLQTDGGRLEIELGGTGQGEFDQLEVERTASLGGTLEVQDAADFVPAEADTFRIVTATSVAREFSALETPEGWEVFTTYGTDHVLLGIASVVSTEPGPGDGDGPPGPLPAEFVLIGGYPNPSSGAVQVAVDLPWAAEVAVEVYDVAGRRVAFRSEVLPAGQARTVSLNGLGLVSGVYFYRLVVSSPGRTETATGRITVIQ